MKTKISALLLMSFFLAATSGAHAEEAAAKQSAAKTVVACTLSGVVVGLAGVLETVPMASIATNLAANPKQVDPVNVVLGGAASSLFYGLGRVSDFLSGKSKPSIMEPYSATRAAVTAYFGATSTCGRAFAAQPVVTAADGGLKQVAENDDDGTHPASYYTTWSRSIDARY